MHSIQLSDGVFSRLQGFGAALVDTPDTILTRLMDAAAPHPDTGRIANLPCDPFDLPDLRHTKVLSTVLDGLPMGHPSWNALAQQLLLELLTRGEPSQVLAVGERCGIRLVTGQKRDEGFRPLGPLPDQTTWVSYQGLGATACAKASVALACCLHSRLDVIFQWRESKPDALHPGQIGEIHLHSGQWSNHPDELHQIL